MNLQPQYIHYGLEKIPFELQPRRSNVHRILIKVHANCQVIIQVPSSASQQEIHYAVKKRSAWIYRQYSNFKRQLEQLTPRNYISGESHHFLGRKYLLKIIEIPYAKPEVKLLCGKLEITINNKSKKDIKTLLREWYRKKAKELFKRRLEMLLSQVSWLSKPPKMQVKIMQNRWGSCSVNGKLTLNLHLIKASYECIDYVILHELCHIAEHNHSHKFYRLMKRMMPNWELVKKKLDGMASLLLIA
jgi:predicted metal-dependent hydrolase